jgi:hypothetical protein
MEGETEALKVHESPSTQNERTAVVGSGSRGLRSGMARCTGSGTGRGGVRSAESRCRGQGGDTHDGVGCRAWLQLASRGRSSLASWAQARGLGSSAGSAARRCRGS